MIKCPLCNFHHKWERDVKNHLRYGHTMGDLIRHILKEAGLHESDNSNDSPEEFRPRPR